MICRADWRLPALALVALALIPPLAAASGGDPLDKARAAIERGHGIAAEVAVDEVRRAGAPRDRIAALMGEAELLQGHLDKAREWLAPGIFAAADRERGFHALGQLEMAEGDLDAARQAFDRALEQSPGSAALWVDIGRMRYRAGEQHQALDAAEKALEADPREPRALEFRAQLERDSGGLVAALPWFERALAQAPDDLGLLAGYAATLGDAGRARDMLKVARRMLEIDSRDPRAYYLQAVLAARGGQDALARRLLWRTGDAYDGVPATMLLRGVLELRTGNAALAVEQFDQLVRAQPDNLTAALLFGRALLAHGEGNEVVARLAPLAQRADASPYLLTLVGRAYEQLGRRAEAAPYLDRAAAGLPRALSVLPLAPGGELAIWQWRDDPDRPEAAVALLREALAQGQAVDASTRAARLLQRYPGSADVAVLAGDVALLTGDPVGAAARNASAAAIRRDRPLVLRMAAAEEAGGDAAGAQAVLADYLAQNPQDGPVAARLGRMAADRGEWQRAGALLAYAASLGSGPGDPYLLADLAVAEGRLGKSAAALASARRAYALQRANGSIAGILARSLQAAGGSERAVAALRARAAAQAGS
ncbi:conserved hypothetical protein [Altererythrobacter sp. B11]|nr:tetratricopeptide repeat protein [Altererythrobacter sp. B11]BBC72676.1 conserved hypothetical protein [Altererythrobacter sp. B11]